MEHTESTSQRACVLMGEFISKEAILIWNECCDKVIEFQWEGANSENKEDKN